MAKCKNCRNLYNQYINDEYQGKWCLKIEDCPHEELERDCEHYEVMTQADRIRSMTDEELAEFIQKNLSCNCGSCFLEEKCIGTRKRCYEIYLEWLQSPVEV